MAPKLYPDLPNLLEDRLQALRDQIKDYQIVHGSIVKRIPGINNDDGAPVGITFMGVTLVPTPFPRNLYDDALSLQPLLTELYMRVATDPEWLGEVLAEMIENDEFTRNLWSIWQQVREEQLKTERTVLGIFRSDYMLHDELGDGQDLAIKQVELNTFGCAGGTHGNLSANMHRYICLTGSYNEIYDSHTTESASVLPSSLPLNSTLSDLTASLRAAHSVYTGMHEPPVQPGILMLAFSATPYSPDERPIEEGLWTSSPPIPTYRCVFPEEVLTRTTLTSNGTLFFQPRHSATPVEIAVAYFRAGHQPHDYSQKDGIEARLQLERSRAINCPDILGHLATFKKVQQALSAPGGVERFLTSADAARVRATWGCLLPLDAGSAAGQEARRIVVNEDECADWILKPSLEGGGHNVYGRNIVPFLKGVDKNQWGNYILMQRIRVPKVNNVLMTTVGEGGYVGPVMSELGVFGMGLWVRGPLGKLRIERNENAGWLFTTEAALDDEKHSVSDSACYDCPRLID